MSVKFPPHYGEVRRACVLQGILPKARCFKLFIGVHCINPEMEPIMQMFINKVEQEDSHWVNTQLKWLWAKIIAAALIDYREDIQEYEAMAD